MTAILTAISMIILQLFQVMRRIKLNHSTKKIQYWKIIATSMIDSGSVCSIITKMLANNILKVTPSSRWIGSTSEKNLKTLSNEPIKVLGKIATTVVYNGWIWVRMPYTCRGSSQYNHWKGPFQYSWLEVVQQHAKRGKGLKYFDNSICKVKQAIASQFPDLVSRICLSKTHVVKSNFHQTLQQGIKKVVAFLLK